MRLFCAFLCAQVCALFGIAFAACAMEHQEMLKEALTGYVDGKDADIGVAVIINGRDTVAVNGCKRYPMLSVYKFPQALAVADRANRDGIPLGDSVFVDASEIKDGTWSPLRDKYGVAGLHLTLRELLALSVQQSDNNACDILFRWLGGTGAVQDYLASIGFSGRGCKNFMSVVATEDEMHRDLSLCYENAATPLAMAQLMDRFVVGKVGMTAEMRVIKELLEGCATGTDRLPAAITGEGVTIGHKTGTGDAGADGKIIGVNDAGYILFPGGKRCAVAVFISGSPYSLAETSAMIGEIAAIVYSFVAETE